VLRDIRNMVESCIEDAGDRLEGQMRWAHMVEELIDEGKIKPEEVSFGELFNVLCDPKHEVDRDNSVEVYEAVHTSGFPYMTNKLISSKVMEAYNLYGGIVAELSTPYAMKRKAEDIPGFVDLDTPDEVLEGMPYHEETLDERRVKISAKKFGRIISLTKELILFDQTGLVMDRASKIGDKCGYIEYAAVINACSSIADTNLGVSANEWLVYDGTARACYANDHSAWDDGANANDNIHTTALGTAGMKAAYTLLRKMKDTQNEFIVVAPPTHLLVPSTLEWDAKELITSDLQFDSAENAKNVFKGGLKVLSSPILDATSTSYWYLGDFKRDIWLGRVWPLTVTAQKADSESAFSSDIIQRYKASTYFGVNAVDYRHRVEGQV